MSKRFFDFFGNEFLLWLLHAAETKNGVIELIAENPDYQPIIVNPEEIDFAIDLIKHKIGKLRELSPLWDMFKEGIDINSIQWAAH